MNTFYKNKKIYMSTEAQHSLKMIVISSTEATQMMVVSVDVC